MLDLRWYLSSGARCELIDRLGDSDSTTIEIADAYRFSGFLTVTIDRTILLVTDGNHDSFSNRLW